MLGFSSIASWLVVNIVETDREVARFAVPASNYADVWLVFLVAAAYVCIAYRTTHFARHYFISS
jgi:hypothetical protein